MKFLQEFHQLSLRYTHEKGLEVLDQRKLPDDEIWLCGNKISDMSDLIKQLSVRGAPLIGVAAVMSLAVTAQDEKLSRETMIEAAKFIKTARPTAVNLMYCCDVIIEALEKHLEKNIENPNSHIKLVCDLATSLLNREIEMNNEMAKFGASLIKDGDGILTHCNTGTLATPGKGTALGVIKEAHQQGKKIHVYVDETRPLLQGGRLTAYELERENIPYTLICDNMAATLMKSGKIQRVFVGADRIATNGDFANKIGTYTVAITAKYHNIPFHAVAPTSTVDFDCPTGLEIPIELRKNEEVRGASGHFGSVRWAPKEAPTYNPAFDVTPSELIESIILDSGIYTREQLNQGVLKNIKKRK